MDLLALIERWLAENPASRRVALQDERCLHSRSRFADCTACSDVCPVGAIQPGKPPRLEEEACIQCGACLPACPVDAYTGTDEAGPLLRQAVQRDHGRVELLCGFHPYPEMGLADVDAAVRLRGCLASLGSGTYLAMVALGVRNVMVRTDACAACPLGQLHEQVTSQMAQAKLLLTARGRPEALIEVDVLAPEAQSRRPASFADAPALSRRDFLRLGVEAGPTLPAGFLDNGHENRAKRPPANRRRMLAALDHLQSAAAEHPGPLLAGLEFASVSVSSEDCTACGACARACPTGALRYIKDEERPFFWLFFRIGDCIGCGICSHVCQPQAIVVEQSPDFTQVFDAAERSVLASGELARCERCGIQFAGHAGERLCSLCDYHRQRPLTAMLPPGFQRGQQTE